MECTLHFLAGKNKWVSGENKKDDFYVLRVLLVIKQQGLDLGVGVGANTLKHVHHRPYFSGK